MNQQELAQLVSMGEGLQLEFKRRVPEPTRVAKEVIAFANTRGGRLLLGVDDDSTIVGVKDAEEEEFSLQQALEAHCDPHVTLRIERIPITSKRDVILVSIPPSAHKPHYLVEGLNGHRVRTAYVRVNDMSLEASKEAVRLMKAEHQGHNTLFELGEKEFKLMRYLEHYGRITVNQFATLVDVSPKQASQTLVLLTRARVLEHHLDPQQDYFTRAAQV
jgi:predicted HTH transcriptional regulator